MKEKLLLIINPVSGPKISFAKKDELERIFSKKYCVSVYKTKERGDATLYAKKEGANYHIVVACGGDGTINEVMRGLLEIEEEKRPVFTFVPGGTTNLLTETLDLPSNMLDAARAILNREYGYLDIGKINDKYFAAVISFGLFTDASYLTNQVAKNFLGYIAYILGGIRSLKELKAYNMTIEGNGEIFKGEYILGAISNCFSLGGVIKFKDTEVSTDDGLFEVMLIKFPNNLNDLQQIIHGLVSRNYDQEYIKFFHASKLKINVKEGIPWSVDGEYFGKFKNLDIDIIPKAFMIK